MAAVSRTTQLAKISKVLKKHYQPVESNPERPVLEHLLLGCCLEDAHYEAAEEAFAAVVHTFFDWNEVRVTSIAELSEVMSQLPDPRAAANRLKRVLQSVFEATYSFDLEQWRKVNLGPTVKWLKKIDGTTNYTIAYVVQSALGGHAIPIDSGVLAALRIVDLVTDEDVEAGVVPGLERAISKAKGVEFGSMLHQFGADFTANPYAPSARKILLEINPDVADRLPKRRAAKKAARAQPVKESQPATAKPAAGRKKVSAEDKKKSEEKPSATTKKKSAGKQAAPKDQPEAAKTPAGPEAEKKSATKGLSKRKPR